MKIIILIIIVLILAVSSSYAQTVINPTTTVEAFSAMVNGNYRFYKAISKDTVDMVKDTVYKCPVCPVCPVCPPSRYAIQVLINPKTNIMTTVYNQGPNTTISLKNVIIIQ